MSELHTKNKANYALHYSENITTLFEQIILYCYAKKHLMLLSKTVFSQLESKFIEVKSFSTFIYLYMLIVLGKHRWKTFLTPRQVTNIGGV